MRKLIHSQVTAFSSQLHCKTMWKARQQMIFSLCNNIYKQWQYQRDKKKLACLLSSAVSHCWIVTEDKKTRVLPPLGDNIIGFILHQLKICPLKCALPHGIESSKNFQTLPHKKSVRTDVQLNCTETRFQKCSQSGKKGSKDPMLSISMAYNVI